jgi:hypothetical protein
VTGGSGLVDSVGASESRPLICETRDVSRPIGCGSVEHTVPDRYGLALVGAQMAALAGVFWPGDPAGDCRKPSRLAPPPQWGSSPHSNRRCANGRPTPRLPSTAHVRSDRCLTYLRIGAEPGLVGGEPAGSLEVLVGIDGFDRCGQLVGIGPDDDLLQGLFLSAQESIGRRGGHCYYPTGSRFTTWRSCGALTCLYASFESRICALIVAFCGPPDAANDATARFQLPQGTAEAGCLANRSAE